MELINVDQRKEELDYHKIKTSGIKEVLRDIEKIKRVKHLKKYIKEKRKTCELMIQVCENNVKLAEGPMHD